MFFCPFRACIHYRRTVPRALPWAVFLHPVGVPDERQLPSGHLDAGRLAILADALEEGGGANADILSHCRSPGPHVRGCWVVDLILENPSRGLLLRRTATAI